LRDSEVCGVAGATGDLGELVLGSGEADLESFYFAVPAFAFGFGDAGGEVVADLGEAVLLGGVGPEYGAADAPCLRCPMLAINPKMLPRLDEIEDDLLARRARAEQEAWLREVEGIDLTLTFLRQKREETKRLARIAPVDLGIPVIAAPR
jgi:hypothetical protein